MNDLLDVSTHFRFGQNWADYSKLVDERRIADAVDSVRDLAGDLNGKTFLDVGSGSGLFSVSALRLGAKQVLATDIDEDSVATTRQLLSRESRDNWRAERISVFELPDLVSEKFDVVYSWGVLHHTGAMWRAIETAARFVKPGGTFVFSIYEKTPFCGFWTREKRFYSRLPKPVQMLMRYGYHGIWGAGLLMTGHNPLKRWREGNERGMSIAHDAHDWLGGFPYESAAPPEIISFMEQRGFEHRRTIPFRVPLNGLLGSGCTEYVFHKRKPPAGKRSR